IKRIRYIRGKPSVLVLSYIPYELAPELSEVNFERESLYNVLEQGYNIDIAYAMRDIEAVTMSKEQAKLLESNISSPAHLIIITTYLRDGNPFERSIGCYSGDLNKFTVKVLRKKIDLENPS